MKKFISSALILFLISGSFISCRKKDKGYPPILPVAETMLIDFSDFTSVNSLGVKGIDQSNWTTAVEIVSPWRELIADLSIPVSACKAATGREASHVSGSKWEWRYTVNVAGATYNVRLTGETSGFQVKWEMYVSGAGSGGFSEFKWLTGTSNTNGTEGKWMFNESYTSQTDLLQIEWKRSGTKIEKIKYTYLKNGLNKDAYIEYGSASSSYDFYYTVHYYNELLGKFSDVSIEWIHLKNGRIKSADYNDGNWKCWDEYQINGEC